MSGLERVVELNGYSELWVQLATAGLWAKDLSLCRRDQRLL